MLDPKILAAVGKALREASLKEDELVDLEVTVDGTDKFFQIQYGTLEESDGKHFFALYYSYVHPTFGEGSFFVTSMWSEVPFPLIAKTFTRLVLQM